MTTRKIKIGLNGKGILKEMFVVDAQKAMPDAVFYELSKRFLSFRKNEIELGKKGYIDPQTAVRNLPLEKMDVRVNFEQTLFNNADIKTTVTINHMATQLMKVLHLSTKEDKITKNNVMNVLCTQTLQIVGEIRNLFIHRVIKVNSELSLGGRQSTSLLIGEGRAAGKIPGPHGL